MPAPQYNQAHILPPWTPNPLDMYREYQEGVSSRAANGLEGYKQFLNDQLSPNGGILDTLTNAYRSLSQAHEAAMARDPLNPLKRVMPFGMVTPFDILTAAPQAFANNAAGLAHTAYLNRQNGDNWLGGFGNALDLQGPNTLTQQNLQAFDKEDPITQFGYQMLNDPLTYTGPISDALGVADKAGIIGKTIAAVADPGGTVMKGLGKGVLYGARQAMERAPGIFGMSAKGMANLATSDAGYIGQRAAAQGISPEDFTTILNGVKSGDITSGRAAYLLGLGTEEGSPWSTKLIHLAHMVGGDPLQSLHDASAVPEIGQEVAQSPDAYYWSNLPATVQRAAQKYYGYVPSDPGMIQKGYNTLNTALKKMMQATGVGVVQTAYDDAVKGELGGIDLGDQAANYAKSAMNRGVLPEYERFMGGRIVHPDLTDTAGAIMDANSPALDAGSNTVGQAVKKGAIGWGAEGALSGGFQSGAMTPFALDPTMIATSGAAGAAGGALNELGYRAAMKGYGAVENTPRQAMFLKGATDYLAGKAPTPGIVTPGLRDAAYQDLSTMAGDAWPQISQKLQDEGYLVSPQAFGQIATDAGVAPDVVNEMVPRYTDLHEGAVQAGLATSNKYFFNLDRNSNFLEGMRKVFPFAAWPAKNIPFYAQQFEEHPWLPSLLGNYQNKSMLINQHLGMGPGYLGKVPVGHLGNGTIWINPLDPLSISAQTQVPDTFDQRNPSPPQQAMALLDAIGFRPSPLIDYGSQVLGLTDPKTDFAPINAWDKTTSYLGQALTGLPIDAEYLPGQEIGNGLRQYLDQKFGWDNATDRVGPEFLTQKRLAELSQAQDHTDFRWNPPFMAAISDPYNPMARDVGREVGREQLLMRLGRYLPFEPGWVSDTEMPIRQARERIYWPEHYGFMDPKELERNNRLAFTYSRLNQDPIQMQVLAASMMSPAQREAFLNDPRHALANYAWQAQDIAARTQGAPSTNYSVQQYLRDAQYGRPLVPPITVDNPQSAPITVGGAPSIPIGVR